MQKTYYDQITVFMQLLYRDYYIFRQQFLHRFKIACYWTLLSTFVTNMFLPSMGLCNFGPFILISSCISYGLFIGMQNAINLVDDITSDQAILYELTLPIPQWLIFFKIAISNMIQGFALSISMIPCGLIVLGNIYAFEHFSWIKCITIFVIANMFYGSFSLILATFLRNMEEIDNIWLRILFPVWYLGCYQFPWVTLHKVSPALGYLNFLNPLTFIMEGARAATISPVTSLRFEICCIMILCYAIIALYAGIVCMKKRLDCL